MKDGYHCRSGESQFEGQVSQHRVGDSSLKDGYYSRVWGIIA